MQIIKNKLMQVKRMQKKERGVAMFMAIFALLLLTAIAAGFVFMANTETAINSNYRTAQQAYFGAKAGLEEARARITTGATGADIINAATTPAIPTTTPNTSSAQVLYILNQRGSETIEPWTTTNAYFDDTLCKANYPGLGLSYGSAGVACAATAPTGTAWHSAVNSILPGRGTTDAFPVKWTRLSLKVNRSSSPQGVDGSGNPTYPYQVSGTTTTHDVQVCWDGGKQVIKPATYASCAQPPSGGFEMRPVYLLTSLAILPNGSRRVLSMEVADDPPFMSNSAINSQDYVTLNGALTIDGYDSCSCRCGTTTSKSGKVSEDCSIREANTPYASSCLADKYAIFSNSGVDKPTNAENITAGTNPVIAENQSSKYDLDRMIDYYRNMAETKDVTLTTYQTSDGASKNSSGVACASGVTGCSATYGYSCSGSPLACGTQSSQNFGIPPALPPAPDPTAPLNRKADGTPCTAGSSGCLDQSRQVTYVPGNLKLTSSAKGNGVLVINGDLEINGGMEFYGLILVKGVVKFTGGGSDKTNIYGSILAGQSSIDQVVLGGSASIKYNRCALLNTTSAQPPRMLNVKEMQF